MWTLSTRACHQVNADKRQNPSVLPNRSNQHSHQAAADNTSHITVVTSISPATPKYEVWLLSSKTTCTAPNLDLLSPNYMHSASFCCTPICFTTFRSNAPCQCTHLLHVRSLIFSIKPFGWLFSFMLTPYFGFTPNVAEHNKGAKQGLV